MPATRSRAAAGLLTGLLLLAGCGDLEEAASAKGIASNNLVSQMVTQLSASNTLTYTAAYHLAGGGDATVTQAQNPPRTSFEYPSGRLLLTDKATTACSAGACTVTAPPGGGARLPAGTFAAAQQTGMIAPATVIALLDTAALDTAVTVTPHDTTLAGHHATCLDLGGVDDASARNFTVCVTSDGVLGTFKGTVTGAEIDMTLTGYEPSAPAGAFTTPPGAKVTDKRKPA
ncbi:hypothetical protein AB0M20_04785 [Actinoplanes sp. NPDC051633]|uniref:hypothetical protein n=1 Tax=Actinoplanes sp. NPDC051633 TaxID=3155670 RepID=UPI0034398EC3